MLNQIRIILVGTTHTGNIGSVARAMKTMGLSELYLVAPKELPDGQAYALSAGASDILAHAKVFDTLQQAISDCALVVGSSARSRTLSWPMLEPRECGVKAVQEAEKQPVALVFGRESSGLTNEELQLCNYHVCIPANPEYSSLNLAMAVQIVTYEVRMAWLATEGRPAKQSAVVDPDEEPVAADELESFYRHLEQALVEIRFLDPAKPRHLMSRLRRLYGRSAVSRLEMNILRGILTETIKAARGEHPKQEKADV